MSTIIKHVVIVVVNALVVGWWPSSSLTDAESCCCCLQVTLRLGDMWGTSSLSLQVLWVVIISGALTGY